MYTQCPDCSTAFRITAEVLKQAAGKVRCGGCGNAFNALEYLSEQVPEQVPENDHATPAPELTAEPRDNDDGPMSISAEHSAALMKTLDELEGSDIRIEDTGVEWRVLDEDDFPDEEDDEISASVEELRFDDDTPLPDDFHLDDESAPEPEPTDIEEPETQLADDTESDVAEDPEPADVSLGEPGEWADILDEVDETDGAAELLLETEAAAELPLEAELAALEDAEKPPDVDTQFALQAEAMGIDTSGVHQSMIEEPAEVVDAEPHEDPEEAGDEELAPLEFGSVDTAIKELEAASDVFDQNYFDTALEAGPDEDKDESEEDGDKAEDHASPQLTEEELTRNMMIDEDLLKLSVEDEDGFASTIVIEEKGAEDIAIAEKESIASEETRSPGFESIVMEGEFVSSALDAGKHEADVAAAAILAEQSRGNDDEKYVPASIARRRTVIATIAALALLLAVQIVHQSREMLATIPAFHKVASPAYRTIGMPLSPAWDVTGWRIEATFDELQGNSDTGEEQLNISSRIGNKSEKALPYPLVSVSLTDRFEETVGSRVLEPGDYLADDLDPRDMVQPGDTFNAAISIQSPAKEVAGYRLKVCYRLSNRQLRCNVPVFK